MQRPTLTVEQRGYPAMAGCKSCGRYQQADRHIDGYCQACIDRAGGTPTNECRAWTRDEAKRVAIVRRGLPRK